MKNLLAVAVLAIVTLFGAASVASAQGTLSKNTEVYVGYQFVRVNPDVRTPNFRFDRTSDSNGVNASLTGYFKNVGLTGEVAANFSGGANDNSLVTAMGGLTIKAKSNKTFQPFIRGLVGGARIRAANQQLTNFTDRSDVGLAFAGGIGLDVKVGKTVSLRLLQADYLQTRIFNNVQHNVRLGAGLVF